MEVNAVMQAYLFVIFMINGMLIGILFDLFRILRKSFKTPDIITYLQDIAFWIIAGVLTLYSIFKFNNGEIRSYIFIAIMIGAIIYMLTFSKYFVKVNVFIIDKIKRTIHIAINAIMYPFKMVYQLLKNIFVKPITFIFVNFRSFSRKCFQNLQKFEINTKNSKNKRKNTIQKKDFNV